MNLPKYVFHIDTFRGKLGSKSLGQQIFETIIFQFYNSTVCRIKGEQGEIVMEFDVLE